MSDTEIIGYTCRCCGTARIEAWRRCGDVEIVKAMAERGALICELCLADIEELIEAGDDPEA